MEGFLKNKPPLYLSPPPTLSLTLTSVCLFKHQLRRQSISYRNNQSNRYKNARENRGHKTVLCVICMET